MIDLTQATYNPTIESIVDVLCNKTSNTDRGFFRVEVAYFLAKMAAAQKVIIQSKDRGEIPVNLYAICLGTSGYGKGNSVNVMETEFIHGFKRQFSNTFTEIADMKLQKKASDLSAVNGSDYDQEYEKLTKEFINLGSYPFTFDSGTTPAIKQLRTKLLISEIGSINYQMDEIGSNLIGNTEVLTTFLELFDQGMIKQKLTKNTHENKRGEDLDGKTPANMLLFGTPSKLFDGSQTEDAFYDFLETGYARRCFFALGNPNRKAFHSLTPEEAYKQALLNSNSPTISTLATKFQQLASIKYYNWKLEVPDDVGIKLVEYRFACEKYAESLPEHSEILKAEIAHRFFKALKLAGAFAFVDLSLEITMEHLLQAILLTEDSGEALKTILNREKPYVKLAKYIASSGIELTHADLTEALPFYKTTSTYRNEQINLATAWGYKNHIIIKKTFADNIELFTGETLKETDLTKVRLAYSNDYAYNYESVDVPFEDIHQLTQEPGMHWTNHHFKKGHRAETDTITGFNLLVLDVDGGTAINTVQTLFKDYVYHIYTTKSHTEDEHRFRIILPINYFLELDQEDYKSFMTSIFSWLPFKCDESTGHRSKKWESFQGSYFYNLDGVLLDALKFIPKTSKNDEYKRDYAKLESLDNLERWFIQKMAQGNRNNNLLRYAMALIDSNIDYVTIEKKVFNLNNQINEPLSHAEIQNTILTTVAKHLNKGKP